MAATNSTTNNPETKALWQSFNDYTVGFTEGAFIDLTSMAIAKDDSTFMTAVKAVRNIALTIFSSIVSVPVACFKKVISLFGFGAKAEEKKEGENKEKIEDKKEIKETDESKKKEKAK